MASPEPLTGAELAEIRRLHSEGKTRNDIARALQRSGSTVSGACARLGLTFDRSTVEAATAARLADAKARRSRLMHDLLDDAERLRKQLFAPCKVHAFGGKDNTYNEADLDQPPFRDQRDIVHSVSTAVAASIRLAEHDADSGADEAKSMLGALAAGLKAAYHELDQAAAEQEPADDGSR